MSTRLCELPTEALREILREVIAAVGESSATARVLRRELKTRESCHDEAASISQRPDRTTAGAETT